MYPPSWARNSACRRETVTSSRKMSAVGWRPARVRSVSSRKRAPAVGPRWTMRRAWPGGRPSMAARSGGGTSPRAAVSSAPPIAPNRAVVLDVSCGSGSVPIACTPLSGAPGCRPGSGHHHSSLWGRCDRLRTSAVLDGHGRGPLGLPQLTHRADLHPLLLADLGGPARTADRGERPTRDVERHGEGLGIPDRPPRVRRGDLHTADDEPAGPGAEPARGGDAVPVELDRLRPGVAQLLEHRDEGRCADLRVRVLDHELDAGTGHGQRAGQHPLDLRLLLGRLVGGRPGGGPGLQLAELAAQGHRLLGQLAVADAELVEQPHEVVLAHARVGVLLGLAHLDGEREADGHAQQHDDHVHPGGMAPEQQVAQPGPAAGLSPAPDGGVGLLVPVAHRPHALNTCRRIAAALEKMRMPRATTTAGVICAPTPSWSPRKTSRAAMSALKRNETAKTRASKTPSR